MHSVSLRPLSLLFNKKLQYLLLYFKPYLLISTFAMLIVHQWLPSTKSFDQDFDLHWPRLTDSRLFTAASETNVSTFQNKKYSLSITFQRSKVRPRELACVRVAMSVLRERRKQTVVSLQVTAPSSTKCNSDPQTHVPLLQQKENNGSSLHCQSSAPCVHRHPFLGDASISKQTCSWSWWWLWPPEDSVIGWGRQTTRKTHSAAQGSWTRGFHATKLQ